jgi:hypothetical protein
MAGTVCKDSVDTGPSGSNRLHDRSRPSKEKSLEGHVAAARRGFIGGLPDELRVDNEKDTLTVRSGSRNRQLQFVHHIGGTRNLNGSGRNRTGSAYERGSTVPTTRASVASELIDDYDHVSSPAAVRRRLIALL